MKKLIFNKEMSTENHFPCFEAAFYDLFDVTVLNIKLLLINCYAYLRTNKTKINDGEYFYVF